MLEIVIEDDTLWNKEKEEFITPIFAVVTLEHSLFALSKWESKFEKPFLGNEDKTDAEVMSYIEEMFTSDFPPGVIDKLSQDNLNAINTYINASHTATWFTNEPSGSGSSETITSELIYYWMTMFNIPFECDKWHLNRLFTLIRVANAKQQKPKNVPRRDAAAQRRALNEQRKKQFNTSG